MKRPGVVLNRRTAKYGNRKTCIDGIVFDSKHEAERWCELKLLERAGEIYNLQRQVPFVIIPELIDASGRKVKETKYIADFVYCKKGTLRRTVEDAKGVRTDVYKLKKKLMLYRLGITVEEV